MTTQDSPLKTVKRDDFFVVARFMDEGTVEERFGRRHNPFIAIERLVTPRRFMVFKLNFEEVESKIFIKRKEMAFILGGSDARPQSEFRLLHYWEREDQSTDGIMPADQRRRDQIIKDELLPAEMVIPPGGRISGLVVFSDNYPRYGTGTLYIPIFDETEKLIERLEITFEF